MAVLAEDDSKTIVLLVNDYNAEFDVATDKLQQILNRNISGIVLVDEKIRKKNLHKPIKGNRFLEVICDYNNPSSIIKALKPYFDNLLVVNASSERNQPYYRKLIPHIPYIKTPTESSIIWATHKDLMRKMLCAYSTDISPAAIKINGKNLNEDLEVFRHSKYPLISKPAGLAASILVKKANDFSELKENILTSFAEIEGVYKQYRGRGEPTLLVEEFMDGDMYSVDAYINDSGETWILPPVKVTTAASIGLEGYYSYSITTDHKLTKDAQKELDAVAAKSMHAIGLKNSAAHIELFNTKNGWKIIELGPRAGGYRQELYSISYGIDHALNELLVKIGYKPIVHKDHKKYSQVLNIYAEKEGIIKCINGFEKAQKLTNIAWLECHAKPGDKATFCGNGGNYLVDGVVYGDTDDETSATSSKIRDLIEIKVA